MDIEPPDIHFLRAAEGWVELGDWREAAIWSRLDLPAGARIEGPAVLEQPDATIVIEPGMAGRVDDLGNLIVERVR